MKAVMKFDEVYSVEDLKEMNFFVGCCGSGRSVFGEFARFEKATDKHLVFVTDKGTIVKTDYNMNTIGKAKKANYFVSTRCNREFTEQRVSYWNDKKVCFEYK